MKALLKQMGQFIWKWIRTIGGFLWMLLKGVGRFFRKGWRFLKENKLSRCIYGFYKKHEAVLSRGLVQILILSFLLELFIEIWGRGSFFGTMAFIFQNPYAFLYNMLLILATLSLALFFRRRIFFYLLISCMWMALGVTNGVILSFRMTPFTVTDLSLMENGLSILPNYMSTVGIVFALIGFALLITLFVLVFLLAPKRPKYDKRRWIIVILTPFLCVALLAGSIVVGNKNEWLGTYFYNLGYAYEDYGVPYCFLSTWLNRGIKKDAEYSEDLILSIFKDEGVPADIPDVNDKLRKNEKVVSAKSSMPNIIVLQLESFSDPYEFLDIEYSEDPTPVFHELQKNFSSGYMEAPSVGAGTANTEFEILTGMRIRSFGPGEYPYKTVVKEESCESAAFDLKSLGYTAHGIHNHRGAFYGRNQVYANLGFDDFDSVEYMVDVTRTPRNWAKDEVLTGEIMDALDSTEEQDFVFTVSVEGHGGYPTEQVLDEDEVEVKVSSTSGRSEEDLYAFEYYTYLIHDMDKFVGELISELEDFDEDVVLVMYGDHLPVLNITEEDMRSNSLYNTEYVIWDNMGLPVNDKDIPAYRMMAELMDRVGIHAGIMPWFHQTHGDDEKYMEELELLQYDMLYGENYIFGGKDPFKKTDLKMGIKEIEVDDVFCFGNNTYVVGDYFTTYSQIMFDGDLCDTVYMNSTTLKVEKRLDISDLSRFGVSQVGKYKSVMSTQNLMVETIEDVE